jgi:hypothetical protein
MRTVNCSVLAKPDGPVRCTLPCRAQLRALFIAGAVPSALRCTARCRGICQTYLALAREGHTDGDGVPPYVEGEFRRYLECGILAHGSGVTD